MLGDAEGEREEEKGGEGEEEKGEGKREREKDNEQEKEKKYNELIKQADSKFNSKDYEKSKELYKEASKIKNDGYIQSQIDKINAEMKLLTEREELKKQYDKIVAVAAQRFWRGGRSQPDILKLKKNKNLDLSFNCSNFFVFQNYELRFSEIFGLILIRSFPGSFMKKSVSGGVPL